MRESTGQVTDESVLQLVIAMHRLIRSLRRAAMPTDLQPTQLLVLSALATGGPMRIGELAAQVPCSQPTATNVVSGLVTDGMVHRIPDTVDGRAVQVQLTDRGWSSIEAVARQQAELLRQRLAELSCAEHKLVLSAGPLLAQLAQPPVMPESEQCGVAVDSRDKSTTSGS